jgi:hypothetical protein
MTARLLLGRLRKAMRSVDAARSRLDEVAVSPAIGPLPAIIVPVNRPIPAHPVDNPRPGAGAGAFETADGHFVATDLGGDGFEATAQLVDLDGLAGQGSGVAIADAVLVDNGVQVGPPVEDDPADPGAGGYFGERDCCPAAASSAQAASTRACSSWSAGTGVGDEQVEPVDEARVPGGFGAPAAGGGVGGERFGVGPLQLHDQQEAGVGMEVRTMLADVGVGAGALGGGAQAIAVDQPGLDQRRVPPVAAGDDGQLQLGPVAGQQGAELGQG